MQEQDLRRSGIPVFFQIPANCSATSNVQGIAWHLHVKADVPGVDFKATFEVPIFHTTVPPQIDPVEFSTRYAVNLSTESVG